VVVDASGTVKQVTHYYPFGGFFGESTGSSYQAYKYNGKEFERLISEDWYDYGARQMSPDIGRFTTMDPMTEKYYNVSPYAYCVNNPVNAIDPNGKEIWIHYSDADGLKQSFQYFAGMNCNIDNADAQTIVSNLNEMYANEDGSIVLDALLNSNIQYGYMKADTHSEGGEGFFDYKTNITSLNDINNTLSFAEETFHVYQRINNQGGKTDVNEVEAKLFSAKMNLEIKSWNNMPYQDKIAGKVGSPYANSMACLLWIGYSDKDYKTAVDSFFSGSISGSIYKNKMGYVHGTIRKNPLIKQFLPTK
jgi:RHS repeat-associated protein